MPGFYSPKAARRHRGSHATAQRPKEELHHRQGQVVTHPHVDNIRHAHNFEYKRSNSNFENSNPNFENVHPHQAMFSTLGPQPMFEKARSRYIHERAEYIRMLRARDAGRSNTTDESYPTFDSLKLLGSNNDGKYLDAFMNPQTLGGKKRDPSDNSEVKSRSNGGSQPCNRNWNNANSKRNSVDSLAKTIMGSLRSAISHENLYESLELIQYRKTLEAMNRQEKMRDLPKTGHSLFDSLRVQRALHHRREPPNTAHHHARAQGTSSDEGSNAHSSSGSGDEFDYTQKPNCRFSRQEVLKETAKTPRSHRQKPNQNKKSESRNKHTKECDSPTQGKQVMESESDDEWAIPRPKFAGPKCRRTGAGLAPTSHDESDSSSKSTGLR